MAGAPVQEEKVTLESQREKWTNLMAGSKMDFNFTVKVPAAFKGKVAWTFADAGTKNVFPRGRGEAPITADPKKPAEVKIALDVPPLNDGVVLQAQLIVNGLRRRQEGKEASDERTLWIFADDPFFNRAKWFEGLKITLFDSDAKSKTERGRLKAAEVAERQLKTPFRRNPQSGAPLAGPQGRRIA